MKSIKQKEQSQGYAKDMVIRAILGHYRNKLEDLTMEELEEELYAEEETTKFGEIPYAVGSLLDIGLEQKEPEEAYDESIKVLAEDLVERARLEGFIITPRSNITRNILNDTSEGRSTEQPETD
tara:strand:+ start:101 stop:472 length:372 start_codon:yes stop_codon:yes gene_type:complete